MDPTQDPTSLIAEARRMGAKDEAIVGLLVTSGWTEADALRALLANPVTATPVGVSAAAPGQVVVRPVATSGLDSFLSIISTILLFCALVSTYVLLTGWIDGQFYQGIELVQTRLWGDRIATAFAIVSVPTYLGLLFVMIRRLRSGEANYGSPIRQRSISTVLISGSGVMLLSALGLTIAIVAGGQGMNSIRWPYWILMFVMLGTTVLGYAKWAKVPAGRV